MTPRLLIIALLAITLFPLKGLIGPGITDAHDSISHVVRTYSFYESLKQGNFLPRWSQHLNYGYGHPIFMFLYPLPSYLTALVHFLGLSIILSVKIVMGTSFALAGLLAFFWFKELFGTWPAVIGAAVFQLAPYRFVNLYVRNAFGENTATLFIPLVFWLFTKLIKQPNRKHLILASLSLAGLLLSHNAVSLMILPLLCFYALILLIYSKNFLRATSYVLPAMFLAIGLGTFFWFPAFMEGRYTLREIVMAGDTFAANFPYLFQLIIPSWGYSVSAPGPNDGMSFQIGIIQWLVFLTAPLVFLKLKNRFNQLNWLTFLFWLAFAFSVFIMLEVSLPVWQILTVIKKFQFPWRWLTISVVSAGFLAASLSRHFKTSPISTSLIVGLLVLQTFWYWQPKGFLPQSEAEIIASYTGTTDTGESTPIWAIRSQEKPSPGNLSVVSGAPIDYQIHRREAEAHEYTVTASVKTQISDNTLYFPGWKVYVDGKSTGITYADPNWRGEITFPVSEGTHQVRIVFEETKLRRVANITSLISLVLLTAIAL